MAHRIPHPNDRRLRMQNGANSVEVVLRWDGNFGRRRSQQFDRTQAFIDQEVIRLMVPYTPSRNNILAKAAAQGTKIGSGLIVYLNPYGRYQYYGKVMVSSLTGSAYAVHGEKKVLTDRKLVYSTAKHPQAQALWFETVKKQHGDAILRGAAAIAGGRASR